MFQTCFRCSKRNGQRESRSIYTHTFASMHLPSYSHTAYSHVCASETSKCCSHVRSPLRHRCCCRPMHRLTRKAERCECACVSIGSVHVLDMLCFTVSRQFLILVLSGFLCVRGRRLYRLHRRRCDACSKNKISANEMYVAERMYTYTREAVLIYPININDYYYKQANRFILPHTRNTVRYNFGCSLSKWKRLYFVPSVVLLLLLLFLLCLVY